MEIVLVCPVELERYWPLGLEALEVLTCLAPVEPYLLVRVAQVGRGGQLARLAEMPFQLVVRFPRAAHQVQQSLVTAT